MFQGPWGALYALSVPILIFSYSGVALWSLWIGAADFTLPLKFTLIFALSVLVGDSIDRVRSDYKLKSPRQLAGFQSALLLIISVVALGASFFSFFRISSSTPLTASDLIIRVFSSFGLIAPFWFSVTLSRQILRRVLPKEAGK